MKFMTLARGPHPSDAALQGDPMEMIGNLFDVSVVFITGLVIALVTAYSFQDLLRVDSNVTIVTQNDQGEMVVVDKRGKEIKARKVTRKQLSGEGERLGVAYRLKDGKVIYVPDDGH